MIPNPENFEIVKLTSLKQIQRHWKLLLEGLVKLNSLVRPERMVSPETFLRVLLDVVSADDRNGVLILVKKRGEGEFLFFGVVLDNSTQYHVPSLLFYAAYSTGKNRLVSRYALDWVEEWGKEKGYKEIHAWSPRISGSAFHLFEKKWGFRRQSILFTKQLCPTSNI